MNKLIIALSLFTLPALAHVEPTDPVAILSEGSAIKIIEDVNVKPYLESIYIGKNKTITCRLIVSNAERYDRVIKKDKSLIIDHVENNHSADYVDIFFKSKKVTGLFCTGTGAYKMTIQELSEIISKKAVIVHGEPIEI